MLEFLIGFMSWFWLHKFTKSRWVYQRKEGSITLWLRTVKEANSYVIHIRRLLITEEKKKSRFVYPRLEKKISIKSLEMCFWFHFYVLLWTSPLRVGLWEWFYFDEPSSLEGPVTNNKKYNNEQMKTIHLLYFFNFFFIIIIWFFFIIIIWLL